MDNICSLVHKVKDKKEYMSVEYLPCLDGPQVFPLYPLSHKFSCWRRRWLHCIVYACHYRSVVGCHQQGFADQRNFGALSQLSRCWREKNLASLRGIRS